MPSELQRVARGLVDCLDEVPQVVARLQRTAARCRENAAAAIAASEGRATTAAMQLDAAARACEEAAHYLAMAPPKAKAWAERLVGASRPSARPESGSADRNKATGGAGDVAERDDLGRIARVSVPLEEVADDAPLIKVARTALRKVREPKVGEPLEVEIVVDPTGKAALKSEEHAEDRPGDLEVELEVEGSAAATELLNAMAEPGKASWRKARVTIDVDRVTAVFDYDDASGSIAGRPASPE